MTSRGRSRTRAITAVALFLTCLAPPACSSSAPSLTEAVGTSSSAIQGGTVDQTDSAVVAILISSGGQIQSICSGSLVGPNLVLTARHCVATPPNNLVCGATFSNQMPASDFLVTTSYNAAYSVWVSNSPVVPTADGVTWFAASAVNVPPVNDICGSDLAALTLSVSVPHVCPLLPSVDTAPVDDATYKAVGFGITNPNGTTAGERYDVTGMTVTCVGSADCNDNTIATTLEWEGGSTQNKGTCEGDSGGPALDSLGRVMGSVSRGPSNACNTTVYENYSGQGAWIKSVAQAAASAGGYAAAGWVTGGATSNPANGYCGTDAGSMPVDAGRYDGAEAEDASPKDAATDAHDGGVTVEDAAGSSDAAVQADGSRSSLDAAAPPPKDAGFDVAPPREDSGGTPDSGLTGHDASMSVKHDAGDGGRAVSSEDAGATDVGSQSGCSVASERASTTGDLSSILLALGAAFFVRGRGRRVDRAGSEAGLPPRLASRTIPDARPLRRPPEPRRPRRK